MCIVYFILEIMSSLVCSSWALKRCVVGTCAFIFTGSCHMPYHRPITVQEVIHSITEHLIHSWDRMELSWLIIHSWDRMELSWLIFTLLLTVCKPIGFRILFSTFYTI